jgi:hypothetical protein
MLILFLYQLNWTLFSIPLVDSLKIFIFFNICIPFSISFLISNPKFLKTKYDLRFDRVTCLFIVFLYFANFVYAKEIPFFSISSGNSQYRNFDGIPFLYPLLLTFSFFYFFVVSYYFISIKKVRYFIELLILLCCFLLIFSRSMLLFSIFGFFFINFLLNPFKNVSFLRKCIRVIFIISLSLFALYFFGCLGNIRSGFDWNDCTLIERIGKFVNYPSWLPKQYMWAYTYLITPLSNLNLNVKEYCFNEDFILFIASYIPDFISKRIFQGVALNGILQSLLVVEYFNAQSVFVIAVDCYGIFGCYLVLFLLLACIYLTNHLYKRNNFHSPVPYMLLTIFILLSFFYNVFYYSIASVSLIFSLIYMGTKGKKLLYETKYI